MKKNELVTRFTLYSLRTALKKMSISLDTNIPCLYVPLVTKIFFTRGPLPLLIWLVKYSF